MPCDVCISFRGEELRGRRIYLEAQRRLSNKADESLISFTTVCETLNIEPEYLRSGLLHWDEAQRRSGNQLRVARRSPALRSGSILSTNPRPARQRRTKRIM